MNVNNTMSLDSAHLGFRLIAPVDAFELAQGGGGELPESVSGQPVAYFWKDVIACGTYRHPSSEFSVSVDPQRIARWAQTGRDMLAGGVAIPINCDHSDAARDCVGYVRDFAVRGDRLLALCQLIGEDAPLLAARNLVSAGIVPDFTDGQGRRWGDAIVHIALTPVPVVGGQEAFMQAASATGAVDGQILTLARATAAPVVVAAAADESADLSMARAGFSEALNMKLELALSRGAIDAATRDRLGDLLGANHPAAQVSLAMWKAPGAATPIAFALLDILVENRPITIGEQTPLQAIVREIPGAEGEGMERMARHMKAIANRR